MSSSSSSSVTVVSSVPYDSLRPSVSPSHLRSLDLFLPSRDQTAKCRSIHESRSSSGSVNNSFSEISYPSLPPLLILVHGGLWVGRDKSQLHAAAEAFASSGFAVASVNYRLSEEKSRFDELSESAQAGCVRYPDHNIDVSLAVQFLADRENSAKYQYDREQIILFGHSCGAHIITGFALQMEKFIYSSTTDFLRSAVKAIIGIEGIYDIKQYALEAPAWKEELYPVFGSNSDEWESPTDTPINSSLAEKISHYRWMILHSQDDGYMNFEQPNLMIQFLANQRCFTSIELARVVGGHHEVVEQIGQPGNRVKELVVRFWNESIL